MTQFQQTVNIFNALGIPGDIAFDDGGMRAIPANLSSNGVPNKFGYYFTMTAAATAEPSGAAPNAGTAQVGGTGILGGILTGIKQNPLFGTASPLDPLGASLALPDNTIGQLLQRGYPFVSLPGPANPGDLVTYDALTGALNSITPTTMFTAAIATSGGVDTMTVSAVAAGMLAVGQQISGAGIPAGIFIKSLGTGLGGTGTYVLTSSGFSVSSEAMTAPNVPAPAFVGTGYITTSGGVDTLHMSSVSSGELVIGQQIFGTGIAANTVITALGSGVGGTGTYTLNTSGQTVASVGSPIAITGPSNLFVPNAVVERYQADSTGGVAVIKLSN